MPAEFWCRTVSSPVHPQGQRYFLLSFQETRSVLLKVTVFTIPPPEVWAFGKKGLIQEQGSLPSNTGGWSSPPEGLFLPCLQYFLGVSVEHLLNKAWKCVGTSLCVQLSLLSRKSTWILFLLFTHLKGNLIFLPCSATGGTMFFFPLSLVRAPHLGISGWWVVLQCQLSDVFKQSDFVALHC